MNKIILLIGINLQKKLEVAGKYLWRDFADATRKMPNYVIEDTQDIS